MGIKGLNEAFANVFENPNRITFKNMLKNISGEYNDLDFKREMIEYSTIAKHILAMANTEGGIICFGVDEVETGGLKPIGLKTLDDNTEILKKVGRYLPPELKYSIHPIIYQDYVEWDELKNKKFLLIIIEFNAENIPFLPIKESNDFLRTDILCRKNSSSTKCEYQDLQELLNKRIETNVSSSLSTRDLEDLRILQIYKLTDPFNIYNPIFKEKLKIIMKKIK